MGDIKVTEDEMKKLAQFADSEGQVCKGDFINYCRKSEMFASLDKNKDKVVSDIEVTSKAHLAFKALDKNQDGFISKKEFSKISKNLNKEQINRVLERFDENGDGKLDY